MNNKLLCAAVAGALIAGCNGETTAETADTAAAAPAVAAATTAAASAAADTSGMSQLEKVGYSLGYNLGRRFAQDQIELDDKSFSKGVADGASGNAGVLTDEQMAQVLQAFQQEQQAKMVAKRQELEVKRQAQGEDNKKAGKAFLEENAKKDGVVTLDSGLQYKVISEASGDKPKASDTVEVHYRGRLLDGTEFDSSHKRGKPARFQVNQVIPGWTEALQLMPEGSKWELYIPADLAYGAGGTPGAIGPNATLIFEVELLDASVSN